MCVKKLFLLLLAVLSGAAVPCLAQSDKWDRQQQEEAREVINFVTDYFARSSQVAPDRAEYVLYFKNRPSAYFASGQSCEKAIGDLTKAMMARYPVKGSSREDWGKFEAEMRNRLCRCVPSGHAGTSTAGVPQNQTRQNPMQQRIAEVQQQMQPKTVAQTEKEAPHLVFTELTRDFTAQQTIEFDLSYSPPETIDLDTLNKRMAERTPDEKPKANRVDSMEVIGQYNGKDVFINSDNTSVYVFAINKTYELSRQIRVSTSHNNSEGSIRDKIDIVRYYLKYGNDYIGWVDYWREEIGIRVNNRFSFEPRVDVVKGFNLFGSIYIGPNNPVDANGKSSYDLPPQDAIDAAALRHDKCYEGKSAKGPFSALFNTDVLDCDVALVEACFFHIPDYTWAEIVTNKPQKDIVKSFVKWAYDPNIETRAILVAYAFSAVSGGKVLKIVNDRVMPRPLSLKPQPLKLLKLPSH